MDSAPRALYSGAVENRYSGTFMVTRGMVRSH